MSVRIPSYRHHRGSGQALVELHGERIYLGKFGSEASHEKYRRLIAQYISGASAAGVPATSSATSELTINELILAYNRHAQNYYVKDGRPTDELAGIRAAMYRLRTLYGRTPAVAFGPRDFKLVRQELIREGLSRNYIGGCMGRIQRMFRWAATEDVLPVSVFQSLQSVPGLAKGRSNARESRPVLPIDDRIVAATLPHLSKVVGDMIQIHR